MNPNLEMLMQREQLMEDLDCLADEFLQQFDAPQFLREEFVRTLCDAVCRNFPSN